MYIGKHTSLILASQARKYSKFNNKEEKKNIAKLWLIAWNVDYHNSFCMHIAITQAV